MINHLSGLLFNTTIYIKFSSKVISLRYVEKQKTIEQEPVIAIHNGKKRKTIVAVGKESRKIQQENPVNVTPHNAFKHPRTFLWNFELAEATLRYFVFKILQRKLLVKPLLIFHPTENIEGGVTQIEYTGLKELGASIGARKTYIWTGRSLTDSKLTDKKFLSTIES